MDAGAASPPIAAAFAVEDQGEWEELARGRLASSVGNLPQAPAPAKRKRQVRWAEMLAEWLAALPVARRRSAAPTRAKPEVVMCLQPASHLSVLREGTRALCQSAAVL